MKKNLTVLLFPLLLLAVIGLLTFAMPARADYLAYPAVVATPASQFVRSANDPADDVWDTLRKWCKCSMN